MHPPMSEVKRRRKNIFTHQQVASLREDFKTFVEKQHQLVNTNYCSDVLQCEYKRIHKNISGMRPLHVQKINRRKSQFENISRLTSHKLLSNDMQGQFNLEGYSLEMFFLVQKYADRSHTLLQISFESNKTNWHTLQATAVVVFFGKCYFIPDHQEIDRCQLRWR